MEWMTLFIKLTDAQSACPLKYAGGWFINVVIFTIELQGEKLSMSVDYYRNRYLHRLCTSERNLSLSNRAI